MPKCAALPAPRNKHQGAGAGAAQGRREIEIEMTEAEAEWFMEFVIGTLGNRAKRKLTKEAEKRMDAIAQGIERNPSGPGSIAESALEWYLENHAD
jgi:hypothetical protein